MKKFLSVLGGIFLAILLALGAFFGYTAYEGRGLDQSSLAYVNANVPPILATWSKDEMLRRAAPQFLEAVRSHPQQLDRYLAKMATLGKLQEFGDVKGEANLRYTTHDVNSPAFLR